MNVFMEYKKFLFLHPQHSGHNTNQQNNRQTSRYSIKVILTAIRKFINWKRQVETKKPHNLKLEAVIHVHFYYNSLHQPY